MDSTLHPLAGLWQPHSLSTLHYGPNIVSKTLVSLLPNPNSKAFIITGTSLASKTPLIRDLETLLSNHHAGTFSDIKQHAPVADLDRATELVLNDSSIDTIISVGGGSPIDSAKAISYRVHEKSVSGSDSDSKGKWLTHIAIPTTLSAAECTAIAGYTRSDGVKIGIGAAEVYPAHVLYDPKFAIHTPPSLFASTGIRALDHAVETQYHPTATEMPARWMALCAIRELFELLPKYQQDPKDEDVITRLYLAAFASLGFLGRNMGKGGLGLSHSLGYALGSPYGISHGITSCLTLGHVVKLKAKSSEEDAQRIARILEVLPGDDKTSGDVVKDAERVGDRILELVRELGFKTTLTEKDVGRDQVDIIVQRATGGLSGDKVREMGEQERKLFEGVKGLVEGLY